MFWNKSKESASLKKENFPHPYRFCDLYISDKHKQIIFVTFEKLKEGIYGESYNLISDSWPCKFEDLQTNIEIILKRFLSSKSHVEGKWPAYENSKAKSRRSFESDYIRLRLETDMTRDYGDGEVERIKVIARPTPLDKTYSLIGCGHLLNTEIAQIVIDIFEACSKIRN